MFPSTIFPSKINHFLLEGGDFGGSSHENFGSVEEIRILRNLRERNAHVQGIWVFTRVSHSSGEFTRYFQNTHIFHHFSIHPCSTGRCFASQDPKPRIFTMTKKGPWLLMGISWGWVYLPSDVGMIINHEIRIPTTNNQYFMKSKAGCFFSWLRFSYGWMSISQ